MQFCFYCITTFGDRSPLIISCEVCTRACALKGVYYFVNQCSLSVPTVRLFHIMLHYLEDLIIVACILGITPAVSYAKTVMEQFRLPSNFTWRSKAYFSHRFYFYFFRPGILSWVRLVPAVLVVIIQAGRKNNVSLNLKKLEATGKRRTGAKEGWKTWIVKI